MYFEAEYTSKICKFKKRDLHFVDFVVWQYDLVDIRLSGEAWDRKERIYVPFCH